jgi:hypothetical protein
MSKTYKDKRKWSQRNAEQNNEEYVSSYSVTDKSQMHRKNRRNDKAIIILLMNEAEEERKDAIFYEA